MKTLLSLTLLGLSTGLFAQDIDFNYQSVAIMNFKESSTLHYPYSSLDLSNEKESLSLKVGNQCLNFVKGFYNKWKTYASKNNFEIKDLSIKLHDIDPLYVQYFADNQCEESYSETGSVAKCSSSIKCRVDFRSDNSALFIGTIKLKQDSYIRHAEISAKKKECENSLLELANNENHLFVENIKNSAERDYSRDLEFYFHNCHNNVLKLKKRIR